MLNFLNSTILFAAAAALIPLIIHLFSKRRLKKIEFSSIKYLKQMQRRQVRRLKIKQLLLLFLRMLIILIAVLAFARPTTENSGIGSHASTSAIILFDNSASMDRYIADGNLFGQAQKRCEELLGSFGEADEICLLPLILDANSIPPAFVSASTAKEYLGNIEIAYRKSNIQSSYEYGLSLLEKAHNLNKEIFIISDNQKNLLPAEKIVLNNEYRNYFIELPIENNNNIAITSVDFGGQLIMPGHDFEINAVIKNFGVENQKNIIASLFIDGNRISQRALEIKGEEETTITFSKSVSSTGFHEGYIEISDDLFISDNKFYFSLSIPEEFNLLIINGDVSGSLLKLALSPDESLNKYWSVKEVNPDNLAGINFFDYDVIFLASVPKLNKTYVNRLKTFVTSGKSLFVSYGANTDIDNFNSQWSQLTSVIFDKKHKTDFSRAGYYTLLSIDYSHPIFSVYNFENNTPPEIKFYTLPEMHIDGNGQALMSFTGKHPALIESSYGKGKIITFTGLMLPEYSDIASHSFFVPLVSRIAEYLASDLSSYDLNLQPGNRITRSLSLKGAINTPVDMLTPDSLIYKISPHESKGALLLNAQPVNLPGVYHVNYLGREIDRFALNTAKDESDLNYVDKEQFATALNIDSYDNIPFENDIATILSELRYGKELWQIFLWLVVILVIVEIFISRTSEKEMS